MDDATLDKMAMVFLREHGRWGMRTNKEKEKPFEVYRWDDSEVAGSFSELHSFKGYDDASYAMERMRDRAAARAFINAIKFI